MNNAFISSPLARKPHSPLGEAVHDYYYYTNTNRLKRVDGWTGQKTVNYLYDANGNMTQDSSKTLSISYDYRNLPTTAYLKKTLLGRTVSDVLYFYYDGKGQRIKKLHHLRYVCECGGIPGGDAVGGTGELQTQAEALAEGDGTLTGGPPPDLCICTKATYTYYIYSGDNIIAEYGQADTLQNNYVYGGNGRVAIRRKGTQDNKLLFPITDHLGTTRMVVDSTGTVQAKYTYYPFGDNLSTWVSQGTDYKFTGKELDEESNFNLYYFGARYYDPKIARWISVDPRSEKYPSFSPYVYSLDNPIVLFDDKGKEVKYRYVSPSYREQVKAAAEKVPTAQRFLGTDTEIDIIGPQAANEEWGGRAERIGWERDAFWMPRIFKGKITLTTRAFETEGRLRAALQHEFNHMLDYLKGPQTDEAKILEGTIGYLKKLHDQGIIDDREYYELLTYYKAKLAELQQQGKDPKKSDEPPPDKPQEPKPPEDDNKEDTEGHQDMEGFAEEHLFDVTD